MQYLELFILAALAVVVLARLYAVLGRRTGAERPSEPAPARAPRQEPQRADQLAGGQNRLRPAFTGPAAAGLEAIAAADRAFDPADFLVGARRAYEMIVTAYAASDRPTLQSLLTPDVYAHYDEALSANPDAPRPELVRVKSAAITEAELDGGVARVGVTFESELDAGGDRLAATRERWLFQRDVHDSDPNWRLADVDAV